jgi:hypothetical protein
MTASITVGGTAPATSGSMGSIMSAMGKTSMVSRTAWTGYYDNHKLTYISTDTSSKAEAAADHINYAPGLAKTLPLASKIYLVTNGAFSTRGAVFGSAPGESDYTPLWEEVMVTWKNPAKAVALGSDNQINSLVAKGQLTAKPNGTVLNCPIIGTAKGS